MSSTIRKLQIPNKNLGLTVWQHSLWPHLVFLLTDMKVLKSRGVGLVTTVTYLYAEWRGWCF